MATTIHYKTQSGRLKRAFLVDVCHWILEAWGGISFKTVKESFKVTGISNKLDGMRNDLIWNRGKHENATSSEEDEGEE